MAATLHQKLLIQGLYELGDFNGGLAHEINNPLAILLGQISIMKMMQEKGKLTPEKISEKLDKLEDATQRVIDLVESMRKIPRSVTEKQLEPVALSKIINVNSFLIAYHCKKFEIEFKCSDISENMFLECIWEEIVVVLNTILKGYINSLKKLEGDKFIHIDISGDQKIKIQIHGASSIELGEDLFSVCQQIVSQYNFQLEIESNSIILICPLSQQESAA